MVVYSNNRYANISGNPCMKKNGFTLIETVLAMALLLVLVVIIYQGFVSTIQLSKNTSRYEATGDLAAGQVNSKIVKSDIVAPGSPLYAIHIAGTGGYSKNLGVFKFKATPVPNTSYGVAAYREITPASVSRTGFWYSGAALP